MLKTAFPLEDSGGNLPSFCSRAARVRSTVAELDYLLRALAFRFVAVPR